MKTSPQNHIIKNGHVKPSEFLQRYDSRAWGTAEKASISPPSQPSVSSIEMILDLKVSPRILTNFRLPVFGCYNF